jgi:cell division protein ZapB
MTQQFGGTPLEIKDLETKIDELIQLMDELERKQAMMSSNQANWQTERARLLEKNELAKTKVEAMIMRLKAVERLVSNAIWWFERGPVEHARFKSSQQLPPAVAD